MFCATASYYWSTDWGKCSNEGGKAFDSEDQAKAKHKRLKAASSTASGSNYDPAIELEYWELVNDSNDPDLLQSYLDEFPNGKFAPLARLKIKKLLSSE